MTKQINTVPRRERSGKYISKFLSPLYEVIKKNILNILKILLAVTCYTLLWVFAAPLAAFLTIMAAVVFGLMLITGKLDHLAERRVERRRQIQSCNRPVPTKGMNKEPVLSLFVKPTCSGEDHSNKPGGPSAR
tara:strand:- start:2322 stop:2720 length:399 start_codon:yes stop_codon:yes gene_type:complete